MGHVDGLMRRRAFLKTGLVGLASPLLTGAAGASDLNIGQLRTGGVWDPRPTALRRLLWELVQRTSIEAHLEAKPVDPSHSQLFAHPFLYCGGSGAFPPFSPASERNLRRHLTYGGTLLIDSADAEPGGVFDKGVRSFLKRLLPHNGLVRIPNTHVMYKTFYLVDQQAGRSLEVPYLEGIEIENRFAVIYSQNDLAGAWARDAFGRWEYEVTPGGSQQREMSFRLGINVIMYALCLDYKNDLVHTPFILRRRR